MVQHQRVETAVAWALRNLDVLIAVGLGLTIGFLEVFGNVVSDDVASGATLLVLGALAICFMSERAHRVSDIREANADTRRALEDLAMVRTLSSAEVGEELRRARQGTDRWFFKGGTGTYLRAVTLPRCVEAATAHRTQLDVKIEIIDPADADACAAYARFRNTFTPHRASPAGGWTEDRTRKESYATVLAACWYRQLLATLEISVHLSSSVPTLRFDLSQTRLIITQDDEDRVHLSVDRDRPLYDYYVTELHQSRMQARSLGLPADPGLSRPEPTVDEVRALFTGLGLPLPTAFGDPEVGEIIDKALHARNPYGR